MKLKRKRDMFDVVDLIPRPLGRKHFNEDVSEGLLRHPRQIDTPLLTAGWFIPHV